MAPTDSNNGSRGKTCGDCDACGSVRRGCQHSESCAACSRRGDCACPRRALAGRGSLHSFDWLAGIDSQASRSLVEVQFKKTRKSYFLNTQRLDIRQGDAVVVEGSPGQDLGQVTMTGELVLMQMKKAQLRSDFTPKRLLRLATDADMERFRRARDREHDTMIRSRRIAAEMGLKMKIGDVEYQGDGTKAIFYYIADERVDFRKLIRILAETFGVRVEMKQIGARQEAGRIGGIGPCGRPLCCATWLTRFASVGTGAARFQDISMNPQKLAGQCAKLKCCINYEVDTYMEAQRQLPQKDVVLETKEKSYYLFKTDILKREITYSTVKNHPTDCVTVPARRAFEVIALNKKGIRPDALAVETEAEPAAREFVEIVGQDSLTRFDKSRRKPKKRPRQEGDRADRQESGAAQRQRQAPKEKTAKDKKGAPDRNAESPAEGARGNSNRRQHRRRQDDSRPERRQAGKPAEARGSDRGRKAEPVRQSAPAPAPVSQSAIRRRQSEESRQ